jgi:hypothetical protein
LAEWGYPIGIVTREQRMSSNSVTIRTLDSIKSKAWCEKYPEKCDHVMVVARANGKRTTHVIGEPTPENREKARALAANLKRGLQQSKTPTILGPTVEEATEEYLAYGMQSHADRTRSLRRTHANHFIDALRSAPIALVTAMDILAWYDSLKATKSKRTAQNYLDLASSVFVRVAGRSEEPRPNPVQVARERIASARPRTAAARRDRETKIRPLTPSETARLVKAAAKCGPTVHALVATYVDTGARRDEILGSDGGKSSSAKTRTTGVVIC